MSRSEHALQRRPGCGPVLHNRARVDEDEHVQARHVDVWTWRLVVVVVVMVVVAVLLGSGLDGTSTKSFASGTRCVLASG